MESKKSIFIAGIGTGVGKTVVSAIFTKSLGADYWKPVQAGDLKCSDTDKVVEWVNEPCFRVHREAYRLNTPVSPHFAAELEGREILLKEIKIPETSNHLVIEGAGGLMVPLNYRYTYLDWLEHQGLEVILVSRHYLGSINHTLLSAEILKSRNLKVSGIIFNGDENQATEKVIAEITGLRILGRIGEENEIDSKVIEKYAERFKFLCQKER